MNKIYLKYKESDTSYTTLNVESIVLNHRRESFQYTDLHIKLDSLITYDNLIEKIEYYKLFLKSEYFSIYIPDIFGNEVGNCLIGGETSRGKFIIEISEDVINLNIEFKISGYEISEKYPKWLISEIRDQDIDELLN